MRSLSSDRIARDECIGFAALTAAGMEGEVAEPEETMAVPLRRRRFARIHSFFVTRLGDRAVVWSQSPLLLAPQNSELEPDVMLLAPRADFYASALPEPPDVRLLIEVADASLPYDRRTKFPLYARAEITEAWLVDVDGRRVEIHRGPTPAGFREVVLPVAGERFSPLAFADIPVTLSDLLV
jgi:Uma2 family endonuclease